MSEIVLNLKVAFREQIRRCCVPEKSLDYAELWRQAKLLFSSFVFTDKQVFQYTDDDGDSVVVSSDEELACAIAVMKSMGVKVYRFEIINDGSTSLPSASPPAAGSAQPIDKSLHIGVECDQCHKCPIGGLRFKCTMRNDFDLCADCEASAETQPFPMLKIYNPEQAREAIYQFNPNSAHHPLRTCRRGRRHWHHAQAHANASSDGTGAKSSENSNSASRAEEVHPYVACDECGASPICGVRYKCAFRHDFDLCSACEARRPGGQPYPMIKIYNAEQAPYLAMAPRAAAADGWAWGEEDFHHHHGPGGRGPHCHGGRGRGGRGCGGRGGRGGRGRGGIPMVAAQFVNDVAEGVAHASNTAVDAVSFALQQMRLHKGAHRHGGCRRYRADGGDSAGAGAAGCAGEPEASAEDTTEPLEGTSASNEESAGADASTDDKTEEWTEEQLLQQILEQSIREIAVAPRATGSPTCSSGKNSVNASCSNIASGSASTSASATETASEHNMSESVSSSCAASNADINCIRATSTSASSASSTSAAFTTYDVEKVNDVTFPKGSVVAKGSKFKKIWCVRNSGTVAWPEDTFLAVYPHNILDDDEEEEDNEEGNESDVEEEGSVSCAGTLSAPHEHPNFGTFLAQGERVHVGALAPGETVNVGMTMHITAANTTAALASSGPSTHASSGPRTHHRFVTVFNLGTETTKTCTSCAGGCNADCGCSPSVFAGDLLYLDIRVPCADDMGSSTSGILMGGSSGHNAASAAAALASGGKKCSSDMDVGSSSESSAANIPSAATTLVNGDDLSEAGRGDWQMVTSTASIDVKAMGQANQEATADVAEDAPAGAGSAPGSARASPTPTDARSATPAMESTQGDLNLMHELAVIDAAAASASATVSPSVAPAAEPTAEDEELMRQVAAIDAASAATAPTASASATVGLTDEELDEAAAAAAWSETPPRAASPAASSAPDALQKWGFELQSLCDMGFKELDAMVPVLEKHIRVPKSVLLNTHEVDAAIPAEAARAHAEGMQLAVFSILAASGSFNVAQALGDNART